MFSYRRILFSLFLGLGGSAIAADGGLRVTGQLISGVATGQPPLQVDSTTVVSNLNADMLDGMHADEFQPLGYNYVSIPMGAVVLNNGASLNGFGEIELASTGRSTIRLNWTTPKDYVLFSRIYIDLMVFNPTTNSACLASIEKDSAINYRLDWAYGSSGRLFWSHLYGSGSDFPAFSAGNKIIAHRYWIVNAHQGDTLQFGWNREADTPEDNCGVVKVVGIEIAYEANGFNDSP